MPENFLGMNPMQTMLILQSLESVGNSLSGNRGGGGSSQMFAAMMQKQAAAQKQAARQEAFKKMMATATQPPPLPPGPTPLGMADRPRTEVYSQRAPSGALIPGPAPKQRDPMLNQAQAEYLRSLSIGNIGEAEKILGQRVFPDPKDDIISDFEGRKRRVSTGEPVFDLGPIPQTELGRQELDRRSGLATAAQIDQQNRPAAQTDAGKAEADVMNGYLTPSQAARQVKESGVDFKDENALRSQYLKQSQDFMGIQHAYSTMKDLAGDGSGASDVALVFSFFKTIDPASTVREGEFATAASAMGLPQQIIQQFAKLDRGEILSPDLRQDLVGAAGRHYDNRKGEQKRREAFYKGVAGEYGMNGERIVQGMIRGEAEALPPNPDKARALLDEFGID